MLDVLEMIAVITGLLGQVLIAQKRVSAFGFWILSNIALVAIAAMNGLWGLVVMYVVYSVLCVYGIRRWSTAPT